MSSGADKLVILTDVSTGNVIRKYRGHLEVQSSLIFTLDLASLLSVHSRE